MIGPVRPSSSGYVHGAGAMHADMLLKSPSLGMPRSSGLSNPKTSLGPTGADERIIGRAVAYHSPASVGSKKGKAKVEKTMG
ncbi:MAG: hypothetical protein WCP82_08970, partial [Alphaproteobacteria bacterium]